MRNRGKVINYGRIIKSKLSPETEIWFVVSDDQILQSPTTVGGQVESEGNILIMLHVFLTAFING
jgi:hypothetical protein